MLAFLYVGLACEEVAAPPLRGTLRVATATTGSDIDPDGYMLQVGSLPARAIQSNGPPEDFHVAPGSYAVVLAGLAPNCALLGGTVAAGVSADSVSEVPLAVSCGALPGMVRVSVSTSGEDLDLDGYLVLVDGNQRGRVPANGFVVLDAVPAGLRSVALQEVAGNCAVTGEQSITVDVAYASEATAEYRLVCEHTAKIAFIDMGVLKTMNQDGTGVVALSPNGLNAWDPDWSPNGRRIAFSHARDAVWIMESDGSQPTQLRTGGAHAFDPAWAPDGGRLAISLWTNNDSWAISTCDLAGGDLRQITSGQFRDWGPAWSPDGTQLVFVREYPTSARRLFVVNADGSGLVQLTDGVDDREPAWAPDGARIAFTGQGPTGERRVYLVQRNGGGRESLLPTDQRVFGYSPDWSGNGAEILASSGDRLYYVDLATRQAIWSRRMGHPQVGVQMLSWRP